MSYLGSRGLQSTDGQFSQVAAAIELVPVLRYTGIQSLAGKLRIGGCCAGSGALAACFARTPNQPESYRCLRRSIPSPILSPRPAIFRATPSSRKATPSTISGIDSLDFLDIAFAIDKAFGIKLPLEQWTQEVNDGKATTEQYFVLKNLCARIDELVAAKGA